MILSRYKKKSGLFLMFYSWLTANENIYILSIISLASILVSFGPFSEFRYYLLILFVSWLLLSLRIGNIFISSFLMVIYTLPFSSPNKNNTIVAISSNKLLVGIGDYILSYGVNAASIFVFLTSILLIREIIIGHKTIKSIIKNKLIFFIFSCTLLFLLSGTAGALVFSPYPELSLIWLFQYSQLFFIALFVIYLFFNHRDKFSLIFLILGFTVIFQSVISFGQFIKQSSLGLPIEISKTNSVFYSGIDEVNATFRVSGTFHYHNQLALIILVLCIVIVSKALKEKTFFYLIGLIFGLITLVLTQSRSVWIASLFFFFAVFNNYPNEIKKIVVLLGFRRIVLMLLAAFAGLSYILIPRILLSFNSFYEGAGLSLRAKMIKEALETFNLNPFFGYGVGTNESILISMFPNGIIYSFPSAVHLAYFQLLLEVGLLGFIFLFLPFLLVLRFFYVSKSDQARKDNLSSYIFIYKNGLLSFFLYYLLQPHVGIIEFPYLGLILGFGLITTSSINFNE